jgi:hypothetical protein
VKKKVALAIVAALLLAGAAALEVKGRARPALPDWIDDLHPLLGAAPPDSFARKADDDPWADFRGKRFAKARAAQERVLLVGGADGVRALPAIETKLGGGEVVLAARDGYQAAQETILVARFAPVLAATGVIAIDGDELTGPSRPSGWTPEWDWHEASVASPVGEWLARRSGLARLVFVRPDETPAPPEERRRRYLRGARSVIALCEARGYSLRWAFVPPASLAQGEQDAVFSEAEKLALAAREKGAKVELFRGVDALVAALAKG